MKGYLQSTTIWGLAILAGTWLATRLGFQLGPAEIEQLLTALLEVCGWTLALYGRSTASAQLAGLWRARSAADQGDATKAG
jgi:hypothetical protein